MELISILSPADTYTIQALHRNPQGKPSVSAGSIVNVRRAKSGYPCGGA
ncbi:MAG: hypothetical protein LIP06_02150 [Tannerellaceae bacterium]|nr:hypothetical protein [Tannerellaceae bacterium]